MIGCVSFTLKSVREHGGSDSFAGATRAVSAQHGSSDSFAGATRAVSAQHGKCEPESFAPPHFLRPYRHTLKIHRIVFKRCFPFVQ